MNLRYKVLVGYFILIVLIGFMASILVRERHRISEIDSQNSEVQQAIRDIHNVIPHTNPSPYNISLRPARHIPCLPALP